LIDEVFVNVYGQFAFEVFGQNSAMSNPCDLPSSTDKRLETATGPTVVRGMGFEPMQPCGSRFLKSLPAFYL
jgi:hypothetical protein